MYTLIGGLRSRTFRVLWMLEELGLPYRHLPDAAHSDLAKAHNPSGKIPILLVDGQAITDSTAILQFLADRHGALTHPAGTMDRARQDSLTHFLLDELDAVLWTATRHARYLPEKRRVPGIRSACIWEFERSLALLAGRLGAQQYLTGEQMRVPDIIATHCLNWAGDAGFPVNSTVLNTYLARMRSRPAFQKAWALRTGRAPAPSALS